MRWARVGVSGWLSLFATAAPAWALVTVLHEPPRSAPVGAPIPLRFELQGVEGQGLVARASYRQVGSSRAEVVTFDRKENGVFAVEIPADATFGTGLKYHIEVTNRSAEPIVRLGSAKVPFEVDLLATVVATTGSPGRRQADLVLILGFVVVLAAAFQVRYRIRRQAAEVREDLFWVQTLLPVTVLPGSEIMPTLRGLAGELLDHPIDGPRRFTVAELATRLREVRQADLGALRGRASRLLPRRPRIRGLDYRLSDTDPGALAARRPQSESEFIGVDPGAFGRVEAANSRQSARRAEDAEILESIGIIDDFSDQLPRPMLPEPTSIEPDWDLASVGRAEPTVV